MKSVVRLVNLIVVYVLHLGFCSMVGIVVVGYWRDCGDGGGDGCFALVAMVHSRAGFNDSSYKGGS